MRRIGIDVGGTNTDAVLIEDGKVVRAIKAPTSEDVTGGILDDLEKLSATGLVSVRKIDAVQRSNRSRKNALPGQPSWEPSSTIGKPGARQKLPPGSMAASWFITAGMSDLIIRSGFSC